MLVTYVALLFRTLAIVVRDDASVYWLFDVGVAVVAVVGSYIVALVCESNRYDDIEFNDVDNSKNVSSFGLSYSYSDLDCTSSIFKCV